MTHRSHALILALGTSVVVAACGGGSGGAAGATVNAAQTGTLSVAVTDAPIDGVTGVTVEFAGVAVKPADGEPMTFEFDAPLAVDLAALTGETSALLLDGETLPAGRYEWLRLDVNADCDAFIDSFVDTASGARIELAVPGASGPQLSGGFTVSADRETSFVIDWDLRSALGAPNGGACYKLRPSLRVVDQSAYGVIQGAVATSEVESSMCSSDVNTLAGNAVYVFEGSNVVPDDIDGIAPDPITTANILRDIDSGTYRYTAAFLPPGDYTVAFTCQGRADRVPDDDAAAPDDDLAFSPAVNAQVTAGDITVADID